MSIDPIKVIITPDMIEKAKERDKGKYNNRSFMNGDGNFVGFLGEYIVSFLRPDLIHVDCFNYDFLFRNLKLEVKTKHQTVPHSPRGDYEASVDVNSMHQETDFYIFCRIYKIKNEYPYGWVMGGISKANFLIQSRKLIKGDKDGDNGYIVKQDCYNIYYNKLRPLKAI